MWLRILVAFAVFLPTTTALAQPCRTEDGQRCRVTNHIFTDADQVHGGRLGPEGTRIYTRRMLRTTRLIRVREHYMDELRKSVEDL